VEYLIVCTVALLASGLTLFSGFGLGTLLLPAFALFFPVPVAVAATAVVHLANNVFKLGLVGRHADRTVVARFGIPAALAAVVGAGLLASFADMPPLISYALGATTHEVTAADLVVGTMLVVFAILEIAPAFQHLGFERRWLSVGGALSGFVGGLTGMQGALRSAFLVRSGLDTTAFIGTGTVCAVLVDVARLLVYGLAAANLAALNTTGSWTLVLAATASAFTGAYLGKRFIAKTTLPTVQRIVAAGLIILGVGMATGML
jgi:uncharacterized membrane protein YfcA